jgi:hypothetical protein
VPAVKPYSPWVKGYVERMMFTWETWFESRFLFMDKQIADLDQINTWAYEYAIEFQNTRIHSRTKQTRFAAWNNNISGHLRELPDYQTFRKLLHGDPVHRKVNAQGIFSYGAGAIKYQVKDSELFNNWIDVIEYPFSYKSNLAVTILYPSSKENPRNFLLPEKKKYTLLPYELDMHGYPETAHPWGEFRAIKHTDSMNNFKEVDETPIPNVDPFMTKQSDISYRPQTGTPIQPKNIIEPRPIEYTKTEAKLHIAEALKRGLHPIEVSQVNNTKKDTFTLEEINEFVKLFKVQSALLIAKEA